MRKLSSVQILRFYAAGLVLVSHLMELLWPPVAGVRELNVAWLLGALGVNVFFVISGFIMYWITRQSFAKPGGPLVFVAHRAIRVIPLYWLATIASVLIARDPQATVGNLIRSLLFVPFDNPGGGGMVPLLVPGWTLQLELLFYLVFAVALFLPRRVGLIAVAAALIGLAALHGPASHPGMPVALAFYTNPVLSLFVVGMALGALRALIERHGRLPPLPFKSLVMAAVLAGYVAYLVVGGQGAVAAVPRLIYRATPIVVAAMTVLTLENKDNPVDAGLSALGDASYSLYLFHPMMIALIVAVVAGPAAGGHGPAVAVAAAIASLAAALLSYRYVEWPLMAFARRFRRPDAGTPASAASANRFG